MIPAVALLLLVTACGDKGLDPDPPGPATDGGSTTPGDGGTTTSDGGTTPGDGGGTTPGDGGTTTGDGGTTTDGGSGVPTAPTYACPPPPDDAIVFHAGTVVSDQVYFVDSLNETGAAAGSGWHLAVTGISYVHTEPCQDVYQLNRLLEEVKAGDRPGEHLFELILSIPGTRIGDFLGEHGSGNGHLWNRDFAAHQVKVGWHDGTDYHVVSSLPWGWTQSTVCVGSVTPDYLYVTVLWDPVDGPFTTNHHTQVHQPIWFDMEIWPTGAYDPVYGSHRSCASTGWVNTDQDTLFAGYDWPGKD